MRERPKPGSVNGYYSLQACNLFTKFFSGDAMFKDILALVDLA